MIICYQQSNDISLEEGLSEQLFNPIALRMAKTLWSFGQSECNRVKGCYFEFECKNRFKKYILTCRKRKRSIMDFVLVIQVTTFQVDLIYFSVKICLVKSGYNSCLTFEPNHLEAPWIGMDLIILLRNWSSMSDENLTPKYAGWGMESREDEITVQGCKLSSFCCLYYSVKCITLLDNVWTPYKETYLDLESE